MIAIFLLLAGRLDSLAEDLLDAYKTDPILPVIPFSGNEPGTAPAIPAVTFKSMDIHPDRLFEPYLAGVLIPGKVSTIQAKMIKDFRMMLQMYERRQGKDDNFTIRVINTRVDTTLEVFVLENEKERYEFRNPATIWDWAQTDRLRTPATRTLTRKYVRMGIPERDITVKWGRTNQVLEAHRRDAPFIEYEIRLARYLGLSLLATEIGTVETFNSDRLVSSAGARSRYQLMPFILRQYGISHYDLRTEAGNRIRVYEEWHPLLTMEPAFLTLSAYSNAFGHEITGLSAYHTGPANIFRILDYYLTEHGSAFTSSSSVVDAYVWAVTSGYDKISQVSSFRTYSRGYVPSVYGSLRATETIPIDTSLTFRAEQVRLKAGAKILLSEILATLAKANGSSFPRSEPSLHQLYQTFRELNPHFQLPETTGDTDRITPNMNLQLVSHVGRIPVRFFLPLGSSDLLEKTDVDVIENTSTIRFDPQMYAPPETTEITVWDRQYTDLIKDTERFGFSSNNRDRLRFLVARFHELADENPTPYRRRQMYIIQTHNQTWNSTFWNQLVQKIAVVRGESRLNARPALSLSQ